VTVLNGLKKYLEGSDVELVYEKGCDVTDKEWPESEIIDTPLSAEEVEMMNSAVKAADNCDVIIAVLGEDDNCVGESRSRTSLDFPGRQQILLEKLYATGKPVVLVMMNGQPLTVNWADRYINGILEAWFPSFIGGEVVAETLFGDNNPNGKLTVTFPKSIGQIEYNFPFKKGSHGMQYGFGPNGSGKTRVLGALYPFGYGLSYTTFEYKNLKINPKKQASQGEYEITCEITNTGKVEGTEIAQLYVRDVYGSVVTYDSVLRGFERVTLKPGETKTVRFVLKPFDLQILDINMNWTVEPGDFEIMIGASSQDIKLKDTITVTEI
jgi:beta-glucosidase